MADERKDGFWWVRVRADVAWTIYLVEGDIFRDPEGKFYEWGPYLGTEPPRPLGERVREMLKAQGLDMDDEATAAAMYEIVRADAEEMKRMYDESRDAAVAEAVGLYREIQDAAVKS